MSSVQAHGSRSTGAPGLMQGRALMTDGSWHGREEGRGPLCMCVCGGGAGFLGAAVCKQSRARTHVAYVQSFRRVKYVLSGKEKQTLAAWILPTG